MSAGVRSFAGAAALVVVLAVSASPVAGAGGPSTSAPDAAYRESFDKWKLELVQDLKENWLTLAGLFWLKPGVNSFGSDQANVIVMPQGTSPAHAGSFELQGENVTVKFLPGVQAKIDGKSASSGQLQADVTGKPSVIELGGLRMHVIKRGGRIGIRVKDLNSAAARNYAGPIFFPLNMNLRVTAKWVPSDGKKTIDVPNVLGDVTPTPVAGVAKFTIDGQEVSLTDLGGNPAKGLFFVFNDPTAKTDTYPGGRFLETDPVMNGTVVLDFNRAHNPPCAVTPYATCPLAPKDNRLAVAIPAGEKYDQAHGHQ